MVTNNLYRFSVVLCTVVIALMWVALDSVPTLAEHRGRPLSTVLTGAAEEPGPGDPDGRGMAHLTLNQGQEEICFELTVAGIAPATAAHIHLGAVDMGGPVVVGLIAPTSGSSRGCISADAALIKAIRQQPENYYINVHNAAFPAGALRGQLSK